MSTGGLIIKTIEATLGPLYIGSIFATVIYGFTTNQAYLYFKAYGYEDSWTTKLTVSGLWMLNTLQVALVVHMMFYYMVEGHGSSIFLSHLVWSFSLELGVTVFVTFVVRTYASSLSTEVDKLIVFSQLIHETIVAMLIHPTIAIVTTKSFQWILGSKCAASVLADVIITCSMCYFLHASRTGIRKTNDLVNALLIYTINRGVLAILLQRDSLRSQQNRNTSHFSRVPTSPDTQRNPHFTHLPHDHSTEFAVVVTRQTMTVEHTLQSDDFNYIESGNTAGGTNMRAKGSPVTDATS
ncbi:hypothetical protein BU17DRAFT_64670 [Hysterangium stoloniferum]|nr:hypothetical protein BU17DRAFT_64670 [Hysterangium stoloniferum]